MKFKGIVESSGLIEKTVRGSVRARFYKLVPENSSILYLDGIIIMNALPGWVHCWQHGAHPSSTH